MKNEWCVYHHISDTGTTIFALYIDNIITASFSTAETKCFKAELRSHWEISDLGPTKFALGISIMYDHPAKIISISQLAFIDCILEKFNQKDSHPCDMPIVTSLYLTHPNSSQAISNHVLDWMKYIPYHELVGSLNYLIVATCPNIAFAVG